MYTNIQAVNITKALIGQALRYLPSVKHDIEVTAEYIGEGTFTNIETAFVVKDHKLIVNLNWFNQTPDPEIKYTVWKETRHFYQKQQIEAFQKGMPVLEDLPTLDDWEAEHVAYIPKTPITEKRHYTQKIQLDAHTFAAALMAIHCSKADGSIDVVLPPVTAEQIVEGASELYKELIKVPVTREKVDRNAACPCGSGKKYKKCCIRTVFFE